MQKDAEQSNDAWRKTYMEFASICSRADASYELLYVREFCCRKRMSKGSIVINPKVREEEQVSTKM